MAQQLPFTDTDRLQVLTVQIISDAFIELFETFSVELSSVLLATEAGGRAIVLSDQESARLIQDPATTSVTILDDDSMKVLYVCSCCIASYLQPFIVRRVREVWLLRSINHAYFIKSWI